MKKHLKKILVSLFVIAGFVFYGLYQHFISDQKNNAMTILTVESVKSQSANVDIVTGATMTTQAFIISLASALDQAKV